MGRFSKFTTEDHAETEDTLGGGGKFGLLDADAYEATIKVAYIGGSTKSKAESITIVAEAGGKEVTDTVWITNKDGDNFYYPKTNGVPDPKKGKKTQPGYELIDHICIMTTDKPLAEQDVEEKTLELWNKDAKKRLPTGVDVLTELTGQKIILGITREIQDKTEDDGNGGYAPTGDTREVNRIAKVFHSPSMLTVSEAENGREEPVFYESWVNANKGKIQDKSTKVAAGTKGAPRAAPRMGAAAQAPQAGGAAKPAGSLFGKK